jgi:hypothetical protein
VEATRTNVIVKIRGGKAANINSVPILWAQDRQGRENEIKFEFKQLTKGYFMI